MLRTTLRHRLIATCRGPLGSRSFPSIDSRSLVVHPRITASEETVGRTEGINKEEEEVVQVKSVPFQPSCLNTITLSGVVVDDPLLSQPKDGLTVANLKVAVPKSSKNFSDPVYEQFPLSFFNFSAKQAEKFVKKGSTIVVQGRLRIFRDNASMTVDEFALLEEGSWPYAEPSLAYRAPGRQTNRDSKDRTILDTFLRPSAARVHGDYDNGMVVDDIAKQRNIKKSTVLAYLAESAFYGKRMNFEWLTRQCLLGPRGSQYMEIDDVAMAIEMTAKKHQVKSLAEAPMMETRDLLKQVKEGAPFKNSEATINGVTYNQLRVVAALMQNGMTERDWNAFRVAEIPFNPPAIQDNRTVGRRNEAPF